MAKSTIVKHTGQAEHHSVMCAQGIDMHYRKELANYQ